MLKDILIIANPGSGKGEAPDRARELSELLKETYECEIELRETTEVGDATKWAEESKDDGFDTVICLGGDGTVNEVVNGLMKVEDPPLFSFVPMGTANDLGHVLGFDMRPRRAIQQFKELEMDVIDVGQVNDHYFIDIVAIGNLPKAVMETSSEDKNRFGFMAYVIDGAKSLVEGERKRYRITNSKKEIFEFESNTLMVALTSSVAGVESFIKHRSYKDGFFQFSAVKGKGILKILNTLISEGGIPKEKIDNDQLLTFSDNYVKIEEVDADKREKNLSNVDGDEGPALPLTIEVHHKAVRVLRPKREE